MPMTESVIWEVGNSFLNQNGKESLARRLREKGVASAQEHLIGFVLYRYRNRHCELEVAEEHYRKLEATAEQFTRLRQARE